MTDQEKLICPICGEPTVLVYGKYPRKDGMCKKHSLMVLNNELEQCKDCGRWHNVGEKCECQTPAQKPIKEAAEELTVKNDELTCFFCKKPSNGMHFCKDCYHKYKDKEMDIHVKNLINWTITDEYGNQKIPCKSGMRVRSRAEKIIADFFFDHNIKFTYETDIPYRHKEKTIILNPDFYLPDHGSFDSTGKKRGLIIEYNELQNPTYVRTKNFTKESYEEMGFEVIILTAEDINNDLLVLKIRLDII